MELGRRLALMEAELAVTRCEIELLAAARNPVVGGAWEIDLVPALAALTVADAALDRLDVPA